MSHLPDLDLDALSLTPSAVPAGRSAESPPPPATREKLLAALTPACRELHHEIRRTVDELERAVSWGLLYYPPDDLGILAGRLQALVSCIRRLPERLAPCIEAFPEEAEAGGPEPARDEVVFYFDGVQRMLEKDLLRMEATVQSLEGQTAATPDEVERLCELAADLKGKFESSIMSATAALVTQGRWQSLAVEAVLFPEKAEEGRRSRELAASLRGIVEWFAELGERVPFAEIVARWREGQRADQYAFSDLVVLRGQLGTLLRERTRRGLYSGDYHQIRQRETRIAERLNELEWLHRRTWSVTAGRAAELIGAELPRLEQLIAELAALLDVEQLAVLVGAPQINRLRASAHAESGPVEPLAALLRHDDLRLFCGMLLGAVQRRAVLAQTAAAAPEPPTPQSAPAPAPRSAPATRSKLSAAQKATLVEDLRRRLVALQSAQNPRWNAFRMVVRMFDRHGRMPDEMVRGTHPFLEELLTVLIPDLHRLAPYHGITGEVVTRLEATCRGLVASAEALPGEMPLLQRLERVQRFLDALQGVLAPA